MWDQAKVTDGSWRLQRAYALVVAPFLFLSCVFQGEILKASKGVSCVTKSSIDKTDKVIVATFRFTEGKVRAGKTLVAFGKGRTPVSQGCNFSFALIGTGNEVLARYGVWDPRVQAEEDKRRGFVAAEEAFYSARFPFSAKAKEIRVLDGKAKVVTTKDLRSAISKFCSKHQSDKDCQSRRR